MTANDPKGYYASLGVVPTATASEIESAFRHLEKELDPTYNKGPDANFRRTAVREAYHVLSDPDARTDYDAQQFVPATPAPQADALSPAQFAGPVACSRCKKVPIEPRFAAYRYVVSVVFMSFKRSMQGIYCASCARKTALTASAISGIAGWWGIPWGPIWTIPAIISNAFGGHEPAGARDDLAWRHAIIFNAQGNKQIAYALARTLRGSKDRNIAEGARLMTDRLQAEGLDPATVTYRSEWGRSPVYMALQLLFLALIPALFIGLVIAAGANMPPPR